MCDVFDQDQQSGDHNILVLVDFALTMMTTVDNINRDSFNQFQLRIGES